MKSKIRLAAAVFALAALAAFGAGCDIDGGSMEWPSYTVVYSPNGGIGRMEPSQHRHGENRGLNANAFTREGHSFAGWSRTFNGAAEFTDRQVVANLATAEGATVTLFAVWRPHTFTVRYFANGGSGSMAPSIFTYDEEARLRPVEFGHAEVFLGWARDAAGQVVLRDQQIVTNMTAVDMDVINLFARWGSGSFTVTFDINGGAWNVPPPRTAQAGMGVELPGAGGFSRPGYTFVGWNLAAAGAGETFSSGALFTPMGDVTLYARWVVTFTVAFDANGGTGTVPAPITALEGASPPLPGGGGLSKSGYTFAGWNTASDGNGENHSAGTTFKVTGNTTLFANWVPVGAGNSFVVTFNLNGGTGTTPPSQVASGGSSITLPAGTGFSRDGGFVFGGWNTRADGNGVNHSANVAFRPTSSVTLALGEGITLNGRIGNTNALVRINSGGTLVMNTGSMITG